MTERPPPLQQLGVVARLFPQVVSGEKTSTIRWREAPIQPGPMLYVCYGDATRRVVVNVVRCTGMALSQVAEFLDEPWSDATLLAGMREHYPTIALDDIVQVIEHEPPANTPSASRNS